MNHCVPLLSKDCITHLYHLVDQILRFSWLKNTIKSCKSYYPQIIWLIENSLRIDSISFEIQFFTHNGIILFLTSYTSTHLNLNRTNSYTQWMLFLFTFDSKSKYFGQKYFSRYIFCMIFNCINIYLHAHDG